MRTPSILGSKLGRQARIRRQNIVYIVLCILLSAIVIGISVGSSYKMVSRDPANDDGDEWPGMINVNVEVLTLDPATGALTVEIDPWFQPGPKTNPPNCTERQFDIFMDKNFIIPGPDSEDVPDNDIPQEAAFHYTYRPCNPNWRQNVPTFRQTIKLFLDKFDLRSGGSGHQDDSIGAGLQAYPFDSYYTSLYLWVQEKLPGDRKEDAEINVSWIGGVVPNYNLESPVPKFYFTVEDGYGAPGVGIQFNVDRSAAVKAFCFTIVVTNWIISLVFLWITVACVIWKEKVVKELFAIPISVLFAFSAVRSTMPGAPAGFGAFVDYVGILPNFAILTVCSFILIILILVERIKARDSGSEEDSEANSDGIPSKE